MTDVVIRMAKPQEAQLLAEIEGICFPPLEAASPNVLPAYRHQGIAGKLVEYFADLARKRGKKGVILTCKERLIGFYESHGFQCFGVADSSHGGARWYEMRRIF